MEKRRRRVTHVFSIQRVEKYRSTKMLTPMMRMRMKMTLEAAEEIEAGEEEESSLFDVA